MKPLSLSQRFGTRVRDLRLAKGYTQEAFADRCGFFRTYLSRIETGRANPTLNAIEVITDALGLSITELLRQAEKVKL